MNADGLVEEWENLSLTPEEEETLVDVDGSAAIDVERRLETSLIGKIFVKRIIPRDVLIKELRLVWHVEEGFDVEVLGKNIFLFSFDKAAVCNRILRGGPWAFDRVLIVLQKPVANLKLSEVHFNKASFWVHFCDVPLVCLNASMAQRLGNAIGKFEYVDCSDDKFFWGASLRVRVSIDINKPLRRGVKVNLEGPIGGCWTPIRYERLPDFCSYCGMIGHTKGECEMEHIQGGAWQVQKNQYGPWLKFQGRGRGGEKERVQGDVYRGSKKGGEAESSRDRSLGERQREGSSDRVYSPTERVSISEQVETSECLPEGHKVVECVDLQEVDVAAGRHSEIGGRGSEQELRFIDGVLMDRVEDNGIQQMGKEGMERKMVCALLVLGSKRESLAGVVTNVRGWKRKARMKKLLRMCQTFCVVSERGWSSKLRWEGLKREGVL